MPKRYHKAIRFTPSKGADSEAEFTCAEVTSNGGAWAAETTRSAGEMENRIYARSVVWT